jgi:flagellar protein FliS
MNTVDFEKGGVIARDLDRLYDFMLFYLTEANLYRDPKRIQKVIDLLDVIYQAYKAIIEKNQESGDKTVDPDKTSTVQEAVRRVQISL